MGAIVTNNDIDYLRSLYPNAEIDYLTGQEEQMLMYHFRGFGYEAAARAAGYRTTNPVEAFFKKESTQILIQHLRDREFATVNVTREILTTMLFEAHRKASCTAEEVMAIKEIGKLHDLYADNKQKGRTGVTINQTNNTQVINGQEQPGQITRRQLQGLSEEELLKLAGHGYDFALPDDSVPDNYDDVIDVEVDRDL